MKEEIKQEIRQVLREEVRQIVNQEILRSLGDVELLPYEVQKAIEARLGGFNFRTSTKNVNTERDQSDDALGIHYAQAVADGYLEFDFDGSTYYFPVYFSAT